MSKACMAYNFHRVTETKGLLQMTGSHIHSTNANMSQVIQKQTLLQQTTNDGRYQTALYLMTTSDRQRQSASASYFSDADVDKVSTDNVIFTTYAFTPSSFSHNTHMLTVTADTDRTRQMKQIRDDWWPRQVWVGECFFWYQLTRVVLDKRL